MGLQSRFYRAQLFSSGVEASRLQLCLALQSRTLRSNSAWAVGYNPGLYRAQPFLVGQGLQLCKAAAQISLLCPPLGTTHKKPKEMTLCVNRNHC